MDLVRAAHPRAPRGQGHLDAAQRAGAEHGNVRDTEMPSTRPGRRYQLRSRLWCKICRRRMRGATRTGPTRATYTYYRCPHDKSIPRHAAAHPSHPSVTVREDDLMGALTRFFTERVFGPDRAAMLAAALPASAEDQAAQRQAKAVALGRQLTRIDTAENALITELEAPAQPGDPAAQALRNRIRARSTELFTERTRLEAELAALDGATTQDNDPSLLDALPILGDILTDAPHAADRTAPGRLQRPGRLQQRPAPGHHPRHPHRRHPPGHHRATERSPHRPGPTGTHPRTRHPRSPFPFGSRHGGAQWRHLLKPTAHASWTGTRLGHECRRPVNHARADDQAGRRLVRTEHHAPGAAVHCRRAPGHGLSLLAGDL